MKKCDVLIIGAGAAGLMCAIEAGKRGLKVIVIEKSNKPGKKILMSGGGRCNFTNYHIEPAAYISNNAHFCKSALSRYTQWDFIDLVKKHNIPFYEKVHGQLFCINKSSDILNMLLAECQQVGAEIHLNVDAKHIDSVSDHSFKVKTIQGDFQAKSLVVACGGLSIPTLGAGPFGYKVAEQFGHKVYPTRAGLVPFTLDVREKELFSGLSGISVDCVVSNDRATFRENILFTHRGLSGPAILQISSYWLPGECISINLLPEVDIYTEMKNKKAAGSTAKLKNFLCECLPARLVDVLISVENGNTRLAEAPDSLLKNAAEQIHAWSVKPGGTEGYRTAEVTLGGIDSNELSSQTMESVKVSGLYFIGEVVDVTGWLGGYNFQWAWSSAWAAGQSILC